MSGDPDTVEMILGLPAIEAVSSSLRHALIPDPGHVFLVGDYASIEARIVLALSGQHDKVKMLADGQDVYCDMASEIYAEQITKAQPEKRNVGKNTVLGCGFQMGPETFFNRYCPHMDLPFAERVVGTYRQVWAPQVPKLWYGLEEAALNAVMYPGAGPFEHAGVEYEIVGDFLTARLPSRWQRLWYYNPQIATSKFGKPCVTYQQQKLGQFKTIQGYGGMFTENDVQGLARGLLCAAIDRMEKAGLRVVLTFHDEIAVEAPVQRADLAEFEQIMAEPTAWAKEIGIPISVEAWQGDRFKK
jgi:DNA polymerase